MNNLVINNEKILLLLEQAIVNITEDEVNQNEVVLIVQSKIFELKTL